MFVIKTLFKFAIMIIRFCLTIFFLIFSLCVRSQNSSLLSSGDWYEITTNENGIYKIDYSFLSELGINMSSLNINSIKLYGHGGGMLPNLNSDFRYNDLNENNIEIIDLNNNTIFDIDDYILFYGMASNTWKFNSNTNLFENIIHLYADEVSYFININNEANPKIVPLASEVFNANIDIKSYNFYINHEDEKVNLINSGSKWFGEVFSSNTTKNFNFSIPDVIQTNPINVKLAIVSRSFQPSNFLLNINNLLVNNVSMPIVSTQYAREYAKEISSTIQIYTNSSNLDLDLQYLSSDNGAQAWLDYIEINAQRKLKANASQFNFRNTLTVGQGIGAFKIENGAGMEVWNITNPTQAKKLVTQLDDDTLIFIDSLNTLQEYIAFDKSFYLTPAFKDIIVNQNIRNLSSDIEFIIVSHPKFLEPAQRLADFHYDKDNLLSIVVTPKQIYNEFSSGMQDVTAIRDFVKKQYDKEDSKLKYLLLFGDGSFDPKDRILNNTNYIPTYQSLNSTDPTKSYVTDDYFALLDDNEGLFLNDLVDIGVGRFPVSTKQEANTLVDKVEQYYDVNSFGSWRNDVVFIADDGDANDGNTHMWQADSLANYVADNHSEVNIQKIYLDNYLQESTPGGPRSEQAQNAINSKIDKGVLLVNYTGHGGPLGWTQERILEIDQIQGWSNSNKLPLFMTATCKFSYFDNPEERSAGEQVLLNPTGGAIALLSTTRLVYSAPNYNLNTKFIKTVFDKNNDLVSLRLGDIFKETKRLSGTSTNNRNFTLLGNPALRLSYPRFDVLTTKLNDTLKALSQVTIEGQIQSDGVLMPDFNGIIYPTVFDKEIIKTTLGQESSSPMPYRDQNNIIYKGAASVIDGEFSFSFIVPKDIDYNYGDGKISYYAFNESGQNPLDANGVENNFIIGGMANNINYDYDGPEISLYMNDTLFVDGGITNSNPKLFVRIFDFSGINTVGNGIGHDITAILDDETSNPYILNDFYQTNKDDYQNGFIVFPFYNLESGDHRIKVKVWDVFNNSTEAEITFTVVSDDNLVVTDFINYPNPFSFSTEFYFQHNQSDRELDYILNIYSITGVLIKSIDLSSFINEGYRVGPIIWDGTNNFGSRVNAGIYIANLTISEENNTKFINKSTRVILLPH